MKKILFILAIFGAFLNINAKEYAIDKANSSVSFNIKHLKLSNVKGDFKDYEAKIDFANGEFKALEAIVKVASIDTANKTRDNHLQEDDFFKAKSHPNISFKMNKYQKISENLGKITGILQIAGVEKEIALDAKFSDISDEKLGFILSGAIKRSEFKFAPGSGSTSLGDEINLNIQIQAK